MLVELVNPGYIKHVVLVMQVQGRPVQPPTSQGSWQSAHTAVEGSSACSCSTAASACAPPFAVLLCTTRYLAAPPPLSSSPRETLRESVRAGLRAGNLNATESLQAWLQRVTSACKRPHVFEDAAV